MNRSKRYTRAITAIYAAALILTVFSFTLLGFSESLPRFVISLAAVLLAESAVYGYSIIWLRTARSVKRTPPVLISGAFITAAYMAAVILAAVILDGLLELPPLGYAVVQLLILAAGAALLAATGWYGRNAAMQEEKVKDSVQDFLRHRKELEEIRLSAQTWSHAESAQLVRLIDLLENEFKYSDPVSSLSLSATENILSQQIALLRDHVELLLVVKEPRADWEAETSDLTETITATLQRRNRELSALK